MPGSIRTATVGDLDRLVELSRDYYADDGYPHDIAVARAAFARLISDDRLGLVLVTTHADRVTGYLVITLGFSLEYGGTDAFIDEVYLEPAARGRRLGTMAFELAEEWCRSRGVRALHLEVEHDKPDAHRLYHRLGYDDNRRQLMTKRL